MKALLIDVVNQTITEVEIEHTKEIYNLIGNGCHTFCAPVDFPNRDTLFTDDEALFAENIQGCFSMEGWAYPIVGNAVILGSDEEGDTCDCKSRPDDILEKLIWGNKEAAEMHRDSVLNSVPVVIPINWSDHNE
jgi:hypothetical protein